MAEITRTVVELEQLGLFQELNKAYIDAGLAKKWESATFDEATRKVSFYTVAQPSGDAAPAFEFTLPEVDFTEINNKIAEVEEKVDKNAEDIATNASAIEAINDTDTGILKTAQTYADTKVQELADGTVATNAADITVMKGQIEALEAGTYDDTELRDLIQDNADAISGLDTRVEVTEGRLDAIEDVDTGLLAQSKEYTDGAVETAVEAVKSSLASALTYKGSKETESELPTEGNVCGDVWNVTTTDKGTSAEFVWIVDDEEAETGHWEELGTAISLDGYAEKEQVATDIDTAKQEAIDAASADATEKADKALNDAKDYADSLAGNYEVAGTAEAKVKELADGQVATNTEAIATLQESVDAIQYCTEDDIRALFQ